MEPFWDGFTDKTDIAKEFKIPLTELDDVEIIIAIYETGSYDGSAFLLVRKDGELYEVHGSHCSCYSLGDMWELEASSVESLKHRLDKGTQWKYVPTIKAAITKFVKENQ